MRTKEVKLEHLVRMALQKLQTDCLGVIQSAQEIVIGITDNEKRVSAAIIRPMHHELLFSLTSCSITANGGQDNVQLINRRIQISRQEKSNVIVNPSMSITRGESILFQEMAFLLGIFLFHNAAMTLKANS